MKMKKILAVVLAVAMTGSMLIGCGSKSSGGDKDSENDKKQVYVFIRNRGDLSYWDSMAEGGDRAAKDFAEKADVHVVETTGDLTTNLTAMYEAADKGADLIITASDFKDNLVEIAQEYPDIANVIISEDVVDESPENIYGVEFSVSEAGFLGGIAAADVASREGKSSSGKHTIGFIGGMDESIVIQEYLLGFFQGARYYDPSCKLVYNYVGGWNDPDTARTQALTQYNDAKADVIFACAGGSGNGVHKAAAEANRYVVGVDSDQSLIYEEDKNIQDHFLTSILKNLGNVIYNIVDQYLQEGTLPFGEYEIYGLSKDAVGIVEDERYEAYVSDEAKKAIEEAKEKIIDGSIEIEGAVGKGQEEIKSMIENYVK